MHGPALSQELQAAIAVLIAWEQAGRWGSVTVHFQRGIADRVDELQQSKTSDLTDPAKRATLDRS